MLKEVTNTHSNLLVRNSFVILPFPLPIILFHGNSCFWMAKCCKARLANELPLFPTSSLPEPLWSTPHLGIKTWGQERENELTRGHRDWSKLT